jgi:hypothetical protein
MLSLKRNLLFLVTVFMLTAICLGNTFAQTGLIKLEDLRWDEEDTNRLSRTAKEALTTEGIEWLHGESEHFVYHFIQRWMGGRAAGEAETYYSWIKKDLKIKEDRWELKGQIFLFETEDSWQKFVAKSGVDRWSGGVCIGNEIYLLSPPAAAPFTGSVLPHEMSHLVVNRFIRGRIPIWLNEGVAEQQSRKHFVGYTRPKGFGALLRPNVVSEKNYIPLEEMISANDYPSDAEKVPFFYTQSVRLVQYLIEDHPKQDFLEFLQDMADGLKFETALHRVYGAQYQSIENFEDRFKKVAISQVKMVEEKK